MRERVKIVRERVWGVGVVSGPFAVREVVC